MKIEIAKIRHHMEISSSLCFLDNSIWWSIFHIGYICLVLLCTMPYAKMRPLYLKILILSYRDFFNCGFVCLCEQYFMLGNYVGWEAHLPSWSTVHSISILEVFCYILLYLLHVKSEVRGMTNFKTYYESHLVKWSTNEC